MPDDVLRLYFDFVDPISYLVDLELTALESAGRGHVERTGFELRAAPEPLTAIGDALWAPRWNEARAWAPEARFAPPRLVPWTRKAHELHLFAREHGKGDEARRAIFEAHLLAGRDIGRVDELVVVAVALGLDRTETQAVLDVDRFEPEVARQRREAQELGVRRVPAIEIGRKLVQGFHNPADLSTLLGAL